MTENGTTDTADTQDTGKAEPQDIICSGTVALPTPGAQDSS
jgi:hypothetical protein